MKITFDIYNYRDMIRVCGTLAMNAPPDHPAWQYLDLTFDDHRCKVYGANGVQVARMYVPCQTDEVPFDYHLMIHPVKPTSHTKTVELYVDPSAGTYTLVFIDAEGEVLDSVTEPLCQLSPISFDDMYKRLEANLGVEGTGNYTIAVNPKVLLRALESLKPYDKVIFNFASPVQPFRLFPYDCDQGVEYMVFPMRLA